MKTRDINALMRDCKLWQHCTYECKQAFIKQMRGRRYGWDALTDAFNWFVIGWKAAVVANTASALSQINTDTPMNKAFPDWP